MRIVCISDTHNRHAKHPIIVPDGDVLIHAGDATMQGTLPEIKFFSDWLRALPHKHKIFVAGNHDWGFQMDRKRSLSALPYGVHYLEDSGCEIDGVTFWGSPWQPWFASWAFNLPRGDALRKHWDLIPNGVDVLITHSPPLGVMDYVDRGENVGCEDMLAAVEAVRPRLHVFGHIHACYGTLERDGTKFINAALCDEQYEPTNKAIVVDIKPLSEGIER